MASGLPLQPGIAHWPPAALAVPLIYISDTVVHKKPATKLCSAEAAVLFEERRKRSQKCRQWRGMRIEGLGIKTGDVRKLLEGHSLSDSPRHRAHKARHHAARPR